MIFHKKMDGIAMLPMVLLVGGIIFEIAIVGYFVVFYGQQTGVAYQRQVGARAAAEAGIQDALIRIIRDNDYTNNYPLPNIGEWEIFVEIGPKVGTSKTVTSTASTGFLLKGGKSLVATLSVSDETKVTIDLIDEVEL